MKTIKPDQVVISIGGYQFKPVIDDASTSIGPESPYKIVAVTPFFWQAVDWYGDPVGPQFATEAEAHAWLDKQP